MASKMKSRFGGLLGRAKSVSTSARSGIASSSTPPAVNYDNAPVDSPEGHVGQSIRLFCESGSMSTGGEEVLHLPVIVESAESSPTAAAAAAQQIRKFLTREYSSKPHVQYNAIMLIRILCDNPGPSFTKNFDKQFVSTLKELLRNCKDGSTQQILRETLDQLEANKSLQEGMEGLITMWRKEKGAQARLSQGPPNHYYPPMQQGGYSHSGYSQDGERPQQSHRSHSGRQLPAPQELASRIEEARNTAKILLQLIQSTPADEVLNNDLLREFADRCQSAQRSMQSFINCNAPPPDDDTMLTLIETNEQLSLALSRHQRAQLTARKAAGLSPSPQPQDMGRLSSGGNSDGPYQPPPNPPSLDPPSNNLFAAQQQPRQYTTNDSAFASPTAGSNDSYNAPPGPPPAMLARLNSREDQQSPPPAQYNSPTVQTPRSPQYPHQQSPSDAFAPPSGPPPSHQYQQQQQPSSDPFADPAQQEPHSASSYYSNPAPRAHSHTFSIDSEPTYPAPPVPQQISDRPALGAYHNSTITGSYMHRRDDALQGMTMHGAAGLVTPLEIDGNSAVGRTEVDENYSVSPVEARSRGSAGGR